MKTVRIVNLEVYIIIMYVVIANGFTLCLLFFLQITLTNFSAMETT